MNITFNSFIITVIIIIIVIREHIYDIGIGKYSLKYMHKHAQDIVNNLLVNFFNK